MESVKLDYLSGTIFNVSSEQNALDFIGQLFEVDRCFAVANWEKVDRPVNYYSSRYVWNGTGFYIAFNESRPNMRVLFNLAGTEINLFGSKLMNRIMLLLWGNGFKCTRADLAYDLYDDNGTVDNFRDAFRGYTEGKNNIVTAIRNESFKVASAGRFEGKLYENWTVGSRNSSVYFRFYDKRVEQKLRKSSIDAMFSSNLITELEYKELCKCEDYWFRIEIELKRGISENICEMLMAGHDLGAVFAAVMQKSFRIIPETDDLHHKSRVDSIAWYQSFINDVQKNHFVQLPKTVISSKKVFASLQWVLQCTSINAVYKLMRVKDIQLLDVFEIAGLVKAYKKPALRMLIQSCGYCLDSFDRWKVFDQDFENSDWAFSWLFNNKIRDEFIADFAVKNGDQLAYAIE